MPELDYYLNSSNAAANAERNCDYKRAALLWGNASDAAVSPVNRKWAECRSDFCRIKHSRTETPACDA